MLIVQSRPGALPGVAEEQRTGIAIEPSSAARSAAPTAHASGSPVRILIVEDDADTRAFVSRGLVEAGHVVATAADGRDGLFQATDGRFDVIVIDRMLPGIDGLTLVRMLRTARCPTPILMLTAMGSIEDRVEGLEAGADDYLVKPFAFSEFAARVHALARRPVLQQETTRLSVADIEVDLGKRQVWRAGRRVLLQPREFLLLTELMRNPGRVVTRTMLLERVWDLDFEPKTNIVETHLSRLRAKLNAGFDDNAIETVRGAGYMLRGS
jgi:two-component system, OmpR family, response regulator